MLRSCCRSRKTRIAQFCFAGNFHDSDIGTNTARGYPYPVASPRYLLPSLCLTSINCRKASIEQVICSNCSRLIHPSSSCLPESSTALPGYYVVTPRPSPFAITRHVRQQTAALMLLASPRLLSLDVLAGLSSRPRVQLVVRTARHRTDHSLRATSLPTPPPLSNLATSKDATAARDWLTRFRGCPIPRAAVDITFSRSSGPGGQVCPPPCPFFLPVAYRTVMEDRMSIK